MKSTVYLLLAFVIGTAGVSGEVRADHHTPRMDRGFSDVAQQVIPAVVFIRVEKTMEAPVRSAHPFFNDPFDFFGDDFLRRFFGPGHPHDQQRQRQPESRRRFRQQGQGSGFLVTPDGLIMTNNHVVGDVDRIVVTLHDGREFDAELVGTDPHSEVALIRIPGQDLPCLVMGDSDDLDIGEWVLAVGNPFGLSATLTVGVVSALGRRDIGIASYEDFIQTDAAINPGNSGGPLLNVKGEVIGINTAIYSRSGGYMGIGFAIPINMAWQIKNQLVEHGRVERGFIGIGIQALDANLAESFGLAEPNGILITDVQEGSAGEEAGLQAGDIILELNGRIVSDPTSFRNRVAGYRPGTTLRLILWRDEERVEKDVTIGALDAVAEAEEDPDTDPRDRVDLGLSLREITPDMARQLNVEPGAGLLVSEVEHDSPAERAGIRAGLVLLEVNRRPVSRMRDYRSALRSARREGRVLLRLTDGRRSFFVALPVQ